MLYLDYFYKAEMKKFFFYRTPKALFEDMHYNGISFESRMFFSFLLDRMTLSMKNDWIDEQGRVYIFFTLKTAMKATGYGHNKAARLFTELEQIGLIERKKQGQGKPARIYVKNFIALQEQQQEQQRTEEKAAQEENTAAKETSKATRLTAVAETTVAETAGAELEAATLPYPCVAEKVLERLRQESEQTAETVSADDASLSGMPEVDSFIPDPALATDTAPALEAEQEAVEEWKPPMAVRIADMETAVEQARGVDVQAEHVALVVETPTASTFNNVENFAGNSATIVENFVENSTYSAKNDASRNDPAIFLPSDKAQTSGNGKSRLPEIGSADFPKRAPNHNHQKDIDGFNETNPSYPTPEEMAKYAARMRRRKGWSQERMRIMDKCEREVKARINYERLSLIYADELDILDDYVEVLVDVLSSENNYIYVAQQYRPMVKVQERFEQIDQEHMSYILDCVLNTDTKVINPRAYMLAVLFNAPLTIRSYYTSRVNHDMATDYWRNMPDASRAV